MKSKLSLGLNTRQHIRIQVRSVHLAPPIYLSLWIASDYGVSLIIMFIIVLFLNKLLKILLLSKHIKVLLASEFAYKLGIKVKFRELVKFILSTKFFKIFVLTTIFIVLINTFYYCMFGKLLLASLPFTLEFTPFLYAYPIM